MRIIGLTGSIAMGKSTAAAMLRRLGVPVHDADAVVHRLLGSGGAAVAAVERAFPGVTAATGGIDRQALGGRVFGDDKALKRLENILHPLVRRAERRFLDGQRRRRTRAVVLDIPLLFETGGEGRCDVVWVVDAPEFLQHRRVLARPGMTAEKLAAIRARQTPNAEKRRRADVVIPTGRGRRATLRALRKALRKVR